jgi:hypothetical protein
VYAAAPRLGLSVRAEALQSVTRGLVGDTAFAVLPDISPKMTFVLTLLFQLVSANPSLQTDTHLTTIRLASQSYLCSQRGTHLSEP